MTTRQRHWLLGLGGILTLLLVWFAPQDDIPELRTPPVNRSQPVPQSAPNSRATPAAPSRVASGVMRQEQLLLARRLPGAAAADLFKATSWYLPPPPAPPLPPAPAPPPPVPKAPVLPFVFLGQIIEDQQVQVILARGDRVVTVLVGENVDKTYRLESLKAGLLTFVYLPLDIRQTLATGLTQ